MAWRQVKIEGLAPSPRGGHAVAVFEGKLLLFGGADRSPQAYDDLWQLELGKGGTGQWTRISSTFPPSVSCTARSGAALVTVGDKVYLFGGQEPNTGICFNDVLELDPSTWTWSQLQVQGGRPPARHSCVAVAFQDQCLLVFGGAGLHGQLGDVWLFNCRQCSWTRPRITCASGDQPPAAREMSAGVMVSPDELLVFGGRSAEGRVLDEAVLLSTRGDWTWRSSSATQLPRCAHTLAVLPSSVLQQPRPEQPGQQQQQQQVAAEAVAAGSGPTQLLVFGGFSGTAVDGGLWLLQRASPSSSSSSPAGGWAATQLVPAGTGANGSSGGSGGSAPVPRFAHAAACLPSPEDRTAGQVMLVVGGVSEADDLIDVVAWGAA